MQAQTARQLLQVVKVVAHRSLGLKPRGLWAADDLGPRSIWMSWEEADMTKLDFISLAAPRPVSHDPASDAAVASHPATPPPRSKSAPTIANHHASLPAAYRLYLPKEWATDRTRRRKAGVPKEITFKTKPAIALEQLRWACVAGLPRGVVLMDAGYGAYTDLRTNITALGLSYVAGIMPQTSVWAPGTGPQPPKAWSGCGRPPKLLRRDGKHQPISVKKLAFGLPSKAWRKITWREATAEPLSSRFARVRVRAAHRDYWLAESRPEEWLLIEWPEGEEAPTKYWFSTLPANIAFHQLVSTAKLRWRIERDYQELKQEVGLGHFEGRGWRGFHHHATLCIAAYGFLISERETIPPSGTRSTKLFKEITIPEAYRPRGSAIAA